MAGIGGVVDPVKIFLSSSWLLFVVPYGDVPGPLFGGGAGAPSCPLDRCHIWPSRKNTPIFTVLLSQIWSIQVKHYRESQKFWGRLAPLSCDGGVGDSEKHALTRVTMHNFVVLGEAVRVYLRRSAGKVRPSRSVFQDHSRSSELIWIDREPDFLLPIRSDYGPISYSFQDRRRFQSKFAIIPHPVLLTPMHAEVIPLGIL